MNLATFLDKDGTLIEDLPYNVNPDLIRLAPGASEGLQLMHRAGFKLIVITNQSGVARGYFEEATLQAVEKRLRTLLWEIGVPLAGFYYCPHHPEGSVLKYSLDCECRKPAPGLLKRAASDLALDLRHSWFVGDILNDVEAGRRAGCNTILLDNGHETEWELSALRTPHYTVKNLAQAGELIFSSMKNTIRLE